MFVLQGVEALDEIETDIDHAAKDPVNEIELVINSTSDNIAEIHTGVKQQLTSVSTSQSYTIIHCMYTLFNFEIRHDMPLRI